MLLVIRTFGVYKSCRTKMSIYNSDGNNINDGYSYGPIIFNLDACYFIYDFSSFGLGECWNVAKYFLPFSGVHILRNSLCKGFSVGMLLASLILLFEYLSRFPFNSIRNAYLQYWGHLLAFPVRDNFGVVFIASEILFCKSRGNNLQAMGAQHAPSIPLIKHDCMPSSWQSLFGHVPTQPPGEEIDLDKATKEILGSKSNVKQWGAKKFCGQFYRSTIAALRQ